MRFWNLLLVLLFISIAGCNSSSTDDAATQPAAESGTIGVSLLTLQNPFFKVIGDTITEEAARQGYATNVLSADESIEKQDAQVKDFIVSECSAIVLSPCDPVAIGPIIKSANDAGIPVFTVDIPCALEDVDIVCQIATDNYGGGKEAGAGMIEALPAGGKVAVLHYKQAQSCQLRVQGFTEVIETHNASSDAKIEIVQVLEGGAAKDKSAAATDDILQTHGDLAGIFAINDPSALGARAALEKAGKADAVKIIGFDGQPDGKQAIKEGKIYADPIQFPDKMGVEIVKAIVSHSNGEEVEKEILIPTSLYRQADGLADPTLK
ncbi:MAG: substrate-binding domain-containing protein [Planctomycetales bacterium]|nr:substrate-binding domain-containing protein [Planctomycetales bacterium]